MVYLFSLTVVLAFALLVWALRSSTSKSAVRSNLGAPWALSGAPTDAAVPSSGRLGARLVRPAARVARRVSPTAFIERLEHRVAAAGLGRAWPVERVLAAKTGCAVIGAFLGLFWALGDPSVGRLVVAALVTVGAFFAPDLVVGGRADERRKAIAVELPDVIDQLTICVEAGLGFDAAIARIAAVGNGPMAVEFGRMLQDVRFGVARSEALDGLAERVDVPEVRHVTGSLRQAEAYGIPVVQVLRLLAEELRDKRAQRAEEAAQKVPVKMLFPLVFCIFPALLIVMLGPAIIRISNINFG